MPNYEDYLEHFLTTQRPLSEKEKARSSQTIFLTSQS